MNPVAGGGSAGFTIESWESFAEVSLSAAAELAGDRCAHPDCRRPFNRSRSTQRYCSPACRRADQDEARQVGHLLARPALAAREGKHAKDWRVQELGRRGRAYVDQVATRWRDARERRAQEAEARLTAGRSNAVASLHRPAQPAPGYPSPDSRHEAP